MNKGVYGWLLCGAISFGALAATEQVLTVDEVASRPAQWDGRMVKVAGRFSAWKGRCIGPPPLRRSDWMIESDTACMYVSGRLPPMLSAAPPVQGLGRTILVVGKVYVDATGSAYIQSNKVSLR